MSHTEVSTEGGYIELVVSIEKFKAGKKSEFAKVKRQVKNEMLSFCNTPVPPHYKMGNKLIEDVFTEMYKQRRYVQNAKGISAFLFTKLRNSCFLFLRQVNHFQDKYENEHRIKVQKQLKEFVSDKKADSIVKKIFADLWRHRKSFNEPTFAQKCIYEPALKKAKWLQQRNPDR